MPQLDKGGKAPCRDCTEQLTKGPADVPHGSLRALSTREHGHGALQRTETVYRCDACGSHVRHTDSRLQQGQHWMVI